MDQAQAAQGTTAQWIILQVGDHQPLFIADDDVFDHTGAVDQDADLAADLGGYFDEACGKFVGTEFVRRDAPTVEAFKGLDVTGF